MCSDHVGFSVTFIAKKTLHLKKFQVSCIIKQKGHTLRRLWSLFIGYIHNLGEIPFRSHLFTEPQIERYLRYCESEKYSFIHIDSTGGILKSMREQNQLLLYTVMFKDGTDANDSVSLAHAILTDHTVPGIGYFLGNVIHSISLVKKIQRVPLLL